MARYPGGKNCAGTFQWIINHFPPHRVYVELCLGSGAIMRLKRPAESSIGVEIDRDVVTAFPADAVPGLELVHADAVAWLRRSSRAAGRLGRVSGILPTLVYCDPPYLLETRKHRRIYRHEQLSTPRQHLRLLRALKRLPCMVAISGYRSGLYDRELAEWNRDSLRVITRGRTMVDEFLWTNFPTPSELHDYRYVGKNYRERENFARVRKRWKAKLAGMDIVKRRALAAAIAEFEAVDRSPAETPVMAINGRGPNRELHSCAAAIG